MYKKDINNINKKVKTTIIFCIIFLLSLSTYTYIYAEPILKKTEIEDLTVYDSDKGFYEVPMSTNIVPNNEKTISYPTMAITDTMILKDASSEVFGLSIYKLSDGYAAVHVMVGDGNESTHDVKSFGLGDFVVIKTGYPYSCSELTLSQCKSKADYLSEKLFSVSSDGLDSLDNVKATVASSTIISSLTIIATSTISAILSTSTVTEDIIGNLIENSVLISASTTDLIDIKSETKSETTMDTIKVILDNINPAESTLVLSSSDKTPEITVQSIDQNTASLDSVTSINSNYSNNEEIKNAEF